MCQTIPGRVTQIKGNQAEVETEGYTGWFSVAAVPDVKTGDYVLTHADLVVSVISQAEAQRLQQEIRDTRAGGASGAGNPPSGGSA